MRKSRIFEVDIGGAALAVFGELRRNPFTKRAENLMAREMRVQLREMLERVVLDSIRDGSFPSRTGRAAQQTKGGARAFGTTFSSLRGHIVGPAFLNLLENGGTLYPVEAEALTIPLDAALKPDGSPKLGGPRSWANIKKTFIFKSKKTGRAYIAYSGPDKRLVLLYMLVEEAEFKARRFLFRAWQKRKDDLMLGFGQLMLAEFSRIDLKKIARVK